MNKQELLLFLQTRLSDVIKEDKEIYGDDEFREESDIQYDQGWYGGFSYAIQLITEKL